MRRFIEGVVLNDLHSHEDERGFFREVFRFDSDKSAPNPMQLSHSLVKEGVIKGWHGHMRQFQWNYVASGNLCVYLIDNRVGSSTWREVMSFQVGGEKNLVGYGFPPGVLHGYKCLEGPSNVIYVTSGTYDISEEIRIDLNEFSVDLS